MIKLIKNDSGAALLIAILFSLIINGIALTLFATSRSEAVSSVSQVVASDTFNVAEAGINIGLLRIKALMEANDPIDPDFPFSSPPFNLSSEQVTGSETLNINEYSYFDLITLAPLDDSTKTAINTNFIDTDLQTYTNSIDGFFTPETSNPVLFNTYLTGAEPVYSALVDTGDNTLLRGWRVYIRNDNDNDDRSATLVSVGYLLDPVNDLLFQKKIEATIFIHGRKLGKDHDPSGQVTSSETGARTGRFRVTSSVDQLNISSYDLR